MPTCPVSTALPSVVLPARLSPAKCVIPLVGFPTRGDLLFEEQLLRGVAASVGGLLRCWQVQLRASPVSSAHALAGGDFCSCSELDSE